MKKRFYLLVILGLALFLSACTAGQQPTPLIETPSDPPEATPAPSQPAPAVPVITLERTVCHGTCPVYKLAIYSDGKVEYEGIDFVQVKGNQTGSISPEKVQELVSAFEAANYFDLKDKYEAPVTDLPTTITSFTMDGRTKTVSNYGGCLEGSPDQAPKALCDLEEHIDLVAYSAQWTGK